MYGGAKGLAAWYFNLDPRRGAERDLAARLVGAGHDRVGVDGGVEPLERRATRQVII
jgi:hypothetical protein